MWIGRTLEGQPLDEWAVRTFAAWKLGRTGHDDGVALFVLVADRTIAVEVGYGLEGQVPDAVAARIIAEVMAPRLRASDGDGAIVAGARAIITSIEGRPWAGRERPTGSSWPPVWQLVLGAAGLGLLLALAIRNPRAAMWILLALARGAVRSAGGRGGFRGGGGRSGGGGARGRW